jgi:SAM-dependent methyltransferase
MVHAKVCLKWPVFASGESWYKYRQHEESACAKSRNAGRETADRGVFLNRLAEYLREQGYDNGNLWQIVQDQLRLTHVPIRKPAAGWAGKSFHRLQRVSRQIMWLSRAVSKWVLPQAFCSWVGLHLCSGEHRPPAGWLHFGNLRRMTPISPVFGLDRGMPIDRYYIERFLAAYTSDIQGRVLEIGDREYTSKFGGDRVTTSDVLHACAGNSKATLVGNLCTGDGLSWNAFDCIILTQVFHVLWDFKAAIVNVVRALRPGGVLLVTLPGISQISRYDMDRWGEFWRFTSLSAKRLFEKHFASEDLKINAHGNVLAGVALLHGIAAQELAAKELDYHDPDYEVIITVRAVKSKIREGIGS